LKKLISSGYQVSPDALDYITGLEAPDDVVEMILEGQVTNEIPSVISRDFLVTLVEDRDEIEEDTVSIEDPEPIARLEIEETHEESVETESDERIRILKNPEFDEVGSSGTVDDFLALFNDRFQRIKKIYMSRIDTQGAISPNAAKAMKFEARKIRMMSREGEKAQKRTIQTVIGMVSSKRVSKSRNIIIELEDTRGSITCIIPAGREGLAGTQLLDNGNSILLDETICVSGYVDEDGRLIANNIIFPDVPTARPRGRSKKENFAAFISDIHCGSEEFLEDEFDSFVDWLNGKDVDTADKDIVKRIDYLFIAGDLVDGIGVYPNQENNLLIPNVVEQYECIASKLRRINKGITIIAIPGNHDASRQAVPKPPVPEIFAEPLYKLGKQMILLGDPSQIQVDGVRVLLTHGDSMDDLVVNTPGASYVAPATGMKELLRKRHLAPLYGGKTELAPLHRDWMVIDTPPDVVHFGHAHHNAVDVYRNIQIINSGTFQGQTDFMRKQGIIPTPGIVTLFNLRTGQPDVRLFYDLSKLRENGA